ncbi:MAG TPA: hypothetical protein PKV23_02035, partial [Aestuariivirga sp.]|nr:hypothetical protein [Aestuariivirga sp.]
MAESFAFDQNQRRNFDQWLTSDDASEVTPDALYNVLGVAPGMGAFPAKEELQPGFLDKFLDAFGVQTDKVKSLKTLSLKQKQLEPFVNEMLKLKAVDLIHRNAQLRAAPRTTDDAPAVSRTLGFGGGESQGLQPAPTLGGDPAMAGMPLGASSANAAAGPQISPPDTSMPQPLSQGGRFMTPDAAISTPIPLGPQAQQFDYQGRLVPPMPQEELIPQPIRPEPIAAPLPRATMPQQAPRQLKDFERFQAAQMLQSQATGHLVSDDSGKLVPASFMSADQRLLEAPQQQELARIYAGEQPSGTVRLPAAPLMAALKGKQDQTLQGLSAPIKDYLQAKGLKPTPDNIDQARTATRAEKIDDEKTAIRFKEALQAGSQKTRDFLASKTGKLFLADAKPAEIERAIKDATNNDISEHARKAMDSFNLGGLDGGEKEKLAGLQQILHVTDRLKNEFTPAERREFVGYFQLPVNRLSQIIQANPRFAKFDALVNREGIAAFETGGKALTAQEAAIIFGFLPNAKEWSPENFEAKLLEADDYGRSKIHTIVDIATTNRRDMGK